MDSGYTRLRLATHSATAVARWRSGRRWCGPTSRSSAPIFAAWRAAAACTLLLKNKAPAASREEWVLLLTMPKRDAHDVFFYAQVDVTSEAAPTRRRQALLHGLLGQRALAADGGRDRAGSRATLRQAVNALGDTEDVVEVAARRRGGRRRADARGVWDAPLEFGTQGEGAIEGTQRQYVVGGLHSHSFDFSLFNCTWVA